MIYRVPCEYLTFIIIDILFTVSCEIWTKWLGQIWGKEAALPIAVNLERNKILKNNQKDETGLTNAV